MYNMLKNEHSETQTEKLYSDFCRSLKRILGKGFTFYDAVAWDLFCDGYSPSDAAAEISALQSTHAGNLYLKSE